MQTVPVAVPVLVQDPTMATCFYVQHNDTLCVCFAISAVLTLVRNVHKFDNLHPSIV